MVKRMLRPLHEIPNAGAGDVPGLPARHGAELAVFRPARLIQLTGQCLSERVPFHLLPVVGDAGDAGSGYG